MGIPRSQSLRTREPLYEPWQALAELGRWVVTEQSSCFGNVGTSQGHIAGLLRQPVNFRLFSKRIFYRQNQLFQLNGLALAKIKNVVTRAFVLDRGHRSLKHVIDVSVIAARAAISKLIDGLTGVNAPGELMNRQIGPLPRTVHGEITKRHDTHLVEMRIGRAKKFSRDFARAVWAECLTELLILRKRDRFR